MGCCQRNSIANHCTCVNLFYVPHSLSKLDLVVSFQAFGWFSITSVFVSLQKEKKRRREKKSRAYEEDHRSQNRFSKSHPA